jgi:prepilin-type N-terminal cleavage/methylation domain-containing protein
MGAVRTRGRGDIMGQKNGFTLVELLVVVLILGALASIAVPRISQSATSAKNNACSANVKTINSQLEFWYATHGSWPTSLSDLTGDTTYFPDGAPVCPYGTVYSYSTTTHHVTDHNHGGISSKSIPAPPPASPIQ